MRTSPPEAGRWIGPELAAAIERTLAAKEQALLFLNRRGYAPLVLCRACGERLKAPDTDSAGSSSTAIPASWSAISPATRWTSRWPVRTAGREDRLPALAPASSDWRRKSTLASTARASRCYPPTRSTSPDALRDLISRMEAGAIDILIGTQIVAKGHNFPALTLVGVVDADAGLRGGDLRAGERTFQLLLQVAGRAGRADKPGRAIIQTYAPDSPAISLLAAGDRDAFIAYEMDQRRLVGFPPFGRLGAVDRLGADSRAGERKRRRLQRSPAQRIGRRSVGTSAGADHHPARPPSPPLPHPLGPQCRSLGIPRYLEGARETAVDRARRARCRALQLHVKQKAQAAGSGPAPGRVGGRSAAFLVQL